jgi:16S rRNA (cytosine967-C5)-methyltransferase
LYLPQPVGVEKLPGFAQGTVSVQDAGAQKAAEILSAQPGERILDACAAPGGKTCHILEAQPAVGEVVALDIDAIRLQQIQENLDRLQLPATLLAADAAETESWWDGKQFDRILLDAPCSASGVIRRHPDIKVLRRSEDVDQLVMQQQRLLEALWPLLAPGGMLLYVTCSVLKRENSSQMKHFIESHPDCRVVDLPGRWGHVLDPGRQILPGEQGMDGFYYACIRKPGGAVSE